MDRISLIGTDFVKISFNNNWGEPDSRRGSDFGKLKNTVTSDNCVRTTNLYCRWKNITHEFLKL